MTITVVNGSSPTCLGRLYSDILIPSHVTNSTADVQAATRFAQSPQGVMGLTIFFEVRPNASQSSYSYTGSEAMQAVMYTAVNRARTTGFISSSYVTFKAITKNMSSVWVSKSDGSGNLQSPEITTLPSVLNESPTSQNCQGFIYSMELGAYMVAYYVTDPVMFGYPVSFTLSNAAPLTLWFNATGNIPQWGKSYLIVDLRSQADNYFFGQNVYKLRDPGSPLL